MTSRGQRPPLAIAVALARSLALAALALAPAGLAGCGDNLAVRPDAMAVDAPPDPPEIPAPPALGEMIDRVGRPLTAELLIGAGLPEAERKARQEEYARTEPLEWFLFEPEMQRSLALYDALDSESSAGDRCRTPAQRAQLARLFADDRLFVDAYTGPCSAAGCVDYLEVERATSRPSPIRQSGGGFAPAYDAVDVTYTSLVKEADPGAQITPVSDGVERHPDVDNNSFPFLGPPHR